MSNPGAIVKFLADLVDKASGVVARWAEAASKPPAKPCPIRVVDDSGRQRRRVR